MTLRHWPILPALAFSCFLFRAWLVPGALIAGYDFPSFPDAIVSGGAFGWPHLWANLNFGYSLLPWVNCIEVWALSTPLHALGASFPVLERVFWLWPLMIGAPLCGYYLCYRFTRNAPASGLGAFAFAINTWTVGLVERGHIPSLEAFSVFGIILPAIVAMLNRPRVSIALVLALAISVQMAFDIRYAYEALLALAIVLAASLPQLAVAGELRTLVRPAVAFVAALIVLNLDLLLPTLFSPSSLPAGAGTTTQFLQGSHFGSLLGAFSLYFPWYHFVAGVDPFAETQVEFPFLAAALLAWLGLLLTRQRQSSRVLLLLAATGVVLVSETASPFAALNVTLYRHVPGFFLFRDFSKFDALIVPGYAVGLAAALAAGMAHLRARAVKPRWLGTACALAATLAYAVLMRDSLNPLRQSNFVRARAPSAAETSVDAFLRQNLGNKRALMFPGDPRWQTRDPLIAAADAGTLSSYMPPEGLALLNPGLWSPEPTIEMFESPLAPELLRELNVKFVVVPDDQRLYYSFDGRPQRWASIDLLRQLPWMRQVKRFGDSFIFAIDEPVPKRAFFAPYPALVIGSPATLEGLLPLPLWQDEAAAILYDQLPEHADWTALLPNVIEGPTLIDPDFLVGRGGAAKAAQRLDEALTAERYRRPAFSAQVFSADMLSKSAVQWNDESQFAFRFQTWYADHANVSFLLERRKQIPSVFVLNSGQVHAAERESGTIGGSSVTCNTSAIWHEQFDPNVPAIAVQPDEIDKQLAILNPCPVVYAASVAVRAASGDLLPVSASLDYGSTMRSFIAPPAPLAGLGGLHLSDVLLRPGLNLITFRKPSGRALSVFSDYTISDLHAIGGSFKPDPLDLSVRRSTAGDLVYASVNVPRAGMHVGYIDLFGKMLIPMDRHPVCTLKYSMSNVPGELHLVVDLRNRNTGADSSFWFPMQNDVTDYDLYQTVATALDERFQGELTYHADDPLWAVEHYWRGPPSPDDYTLRGVRVAATWSIGESSDVPHSTFLALIRGLRLGITSRSIGSSWAFPETQLVSTKGLSEDNFTLRGLRILRMGEVGGSEPRVDAELSGFTPTGYRLATSLHVGDFIQVALQNDRRIQGTIIAEGTDYILVQDGDNPPQRLARGSIATITEQQITPSAKIEIPIASPFQPTELSFDVRRDQTLDVKIGLVYQAPNGTRESIPAVDREASDISGADVEPEFIKPRVLTGGTVFDLAVPIDLSAGVPSTARWTSYDLDLWDIERYRFGGQARKLVGLTVEFLDQPGTGSMDRQFSVAIANLTVAKERFSSAALARLVAGRPLVTLDGTGVSLNSLQPASDSNEFFVGNVGGRDLPPGDHVIQSRFLDEVRVRAATVSRGTPQHFGNGRIARFDPMSASETAGALEGSGVLVTSHSYDAGWALAVWPPGTGAPSFTGFALVDWLRSLNFMLPRNFHVPANTDVDAWYVPPSSGGARRFLMIYTPEALNELGAAITTIGLLGLLLAWGVTARRRSR